MPEGFLHNNSVVISLLVLYVGNLYFMDDLEKFYVTVQNNKFQVFNSRDIFYGATVGVAFMRVDV